MSKSYHIKACNLIVVILSMLSLGMVSAIDFAGGTGQLKDPYQIATPRQLIHVGQDPNLYDKHFALIADIDMDPNLEGGKVFNQAVIAPVCHLRDSNRYDSNETAFSGSFDGHDHRIVNLTIVSINNVQKKRIVGMFGKLTKSAILRNLGIEKARIRGEGIRVGILAGLNHGGSIINCYTTGTITAQHLYAGGLVGINRGNITRSYSRVTIRGFEHIGGLVGINTDGIIKFSYSTSTVVGHWSIGGLVGTNRNGCITSSYSKSDVKGDWCVGGLVAQNDKGKIITSYSTGKISGEHKKDIGGLVGSNTGVVSSSFWDTETSGQTTGGGGTGMTTILMQDPNTYLEAGWDFLNETDKGTEGIWRMPVDDYPILWWQEPANP